MTRNYIKSPPRLSDLQRALVVNDRRLAANRRHLANYHTNKKTNQIENNKRSRVYYHAHKHETTLAAKKRKRLIRALWHVDNRERQNHKCREYYQAHKAEILEPKRQKRRAVKHRYGLTLEEYDAITANEVRCPICGNEFDEGWHSRRARILDHCHKTGKIRGAICRLCNTGLGAFSDDPAVLKKAAAYLRRNI